MRIEPHTIALALMMSMWFMPAQAQNQSEELDRARRDAIALQRLEAVKRSEADISFYGFVQDQEGNPVAGAEVTLDYLHAGTLPGLLGGLRMSTMQTETDQRGRFSVEGLKGMELSVTKIAKSGYEFLPSRTEDRSFDYSSPLVEANTGFEPDPNDPIVFYMRRRGEPTFLIEIEHSDRVSFRPEETRSHTAEFDLVHRVLVRPVPDNHVGPIIGHNPELKDFTISATYDETLTTCTIVLSAVGEESGIIASEQMLYEAPESGYQDEVRIQLNGEYDTEGKHFYLRSRNPWIYSRIELRDLIATSHRFWLTFRAVTNPTGDRNLEMASDLPSEVFIQLNREAQEALREGRRPPRPDLERLIQEAQESGN